MPSKEFSRRLAAGLAVADATEADFADAVAEQTARGAGRPRLFADGRRTQVYLPASDLRELQILGGGNVSEGVRRALALARL